jgi:hypothetical protein
MSPPTEKRYPVSDGIHHPPLVSGGGSQGICVKSGAVDSPGALVGHSGESAPGRAPSRAPATTGRPETVAPAWVS